MSGKVVRILDKGWIELQDVMGSDLDIVTAARTSFLGESKGEDKDKKLLFYLMEHRHTTPFEMAELKFRVKAPLVVWWQWVRHRLFSFNAQSGRYSEFGEDEFYIPEEWRLQSSSNKQASSGVAEYKICDTLKHALEDHVKNSYNLYKQAIECGIAREQARLFLPGFAVYYTWVAKVDLHNLLHFIELRTTDEAQYEIRQYAQAIYFEFVKPLFPWTAEAFEKFRVKK